MFCSKCGKEIKDNAMFCRFCGQRIKETDRPEVITPPETEEAAMKTETAPVYEETPAGSMGARSDVNDNEPVGNNRPEPAVIDSPALVSESIVSKKKISTGLVIAVVGLVIFLVVVLGFIIAQSKKYQKQLEQAEDGAANWRGGDWTNRDDILPYVNEAGYIVFGAYEQDGDESNGPEPIEWEVLEVNGNETLLASRYVLDCQQYNTEQTVTWESCTLRSWLNDEFLNRAFTLTEQGRINITNLVNPDNTYARRRTSGGNNTQDRIFLLSADEVISHYSFNYWNDEEQYGSSQELIIPPTAYAKQQGVHCYMIDEEFLDNAWDLNYSRDYIGREGASWWLRSPGEYTNSSKTVCTVLAVGRAGWGGCYSIGSHIGVRPALYIADVITTPTPTPTGKGETRWRGRGWTNRDDILPYKNKEGYIVFGAYEQDGDESNGPEPIEWEILEENGNNMFLVSRYVLDAQPYHTVYDMPVTWENCTLRS